MAERLTHRCHLLLGLGFLLLAIGFVRGEDEVPTAEGPLRLKELYVPYEEFRVLTAGNPDGMVMELAEYRKLVLAALRNSRSLAPPSLPPLAAVVTRARYEGTVEGRTAQIQGTLRVLVSQDDWVAVDLGPPLPSLGRIVVDGEPGWLVVDTGATAPAESSPTRASLLIRGRGEHTVEVTFSLPIEDGEEWSRLAGSVIPASSGQLTLTIPGRTQARARPDFLEVLEREGQTRLHLSLGSESRFELEWRRSRGAGENPVLLAAEHKVAFLARSENPTFRWVARVSVARRKADELVLRAPEGATVVHVGGELLHSWEPSEEGIRVTLKEPIIGETELHISGIFAMEDERFRLRPPSLRDAFTNRGVLALFDPGEGRLTVDSAEGLVELDPLEEGLPPLLGRSARRVFAFPSPEVELIGRVTTEPFRFESHAALLMRVREGRLSLQGLLQAEVEEGRAYELRLALPEGWKVTRLQERGSEPHILRHEVVESALPRFVRVELRRALDREHPLAIELVAEYLPFRPGRDWETRDLAMGLPGLLGATRSRTDLGITLHSSLYLGDTELEGWRTLSEEESQKLGLEARAAEEGGFSARLVAALWTENPRPTTNLTLVHRPARGEYRAVTHLIAAETAFRESTGSITLRTRCDLRLAVVDRGVDEIVFRHPPLPDDVTVVVIGDGIQEIRADNVAGTQTVRFLRPWHGTRQFRVEYQTPCRPGEEISLRSVLLDGPFNGERFVVLQSQGSVQIESSAGEGISHVDIDDLPDFAEPWASGRIVDAFRYRKAGDPGTLRTRVHDRAPVLTRLAREMRLNTVIGPDGTTRTDAEFVLAYAREQSLRVELPEDARCLSVAVNGESVRAVRTEAGEDSRVLAIPLPPRSFATISLVYERPRDGFPRPFGSWGRWTERGPILSDIPVGETMWWIHHPEGTRWFVSGGNLQPSDARLEQRVTSFASGFFGRLLRGRLPQLTVFRDETPVRALADVRDPGSPLRQTAQSRSNDAAETSRLRAREAAGSPLARGAAAPIYRPIPEGRRIGLRKFGGDPDVTLSYVSFSWWSFSKRFVFFGTLLFCGVLQIRGRVEALRRFIVWGLVLGTLVPLALHWESPLLAIPLCEALIAAALLHGLWVLGTLILRRARRRRLGQPSIAAIAGLLLTGALLAPAGVHASDEEPAKPPLPKPFDAVLIPYSVARPPWLEADPRTQVFVPDERFRELWALAHPETVDVEPLHDYVIGNSEYAARIEEDDYRLSGSVDVVVLTKKWVTIPLPFDRAQLVRVAIDGAETGVWQESGAPRLELRGRGRHRIELELAGPVGRDRGEYQLTTRLLKGAAASFTTFLPAGARVDRKKSSPGTVVTERDEETRTTLHLGTAPDVRLVWSLPQIEGQLSSQLESLSYSELRLTPDGFDVMRFELLRVAGQPVDRISYRVDGEWQISDVRGAEIAEWTMARDESSGLVELNVFFVEPVSEARLAITGRAVMEERGALTTLTLENAVRQETYVGLAHGRERRFLPDVLSGMERSSLQELQGVLLAPDHSPERLYHVYGSGTGEELRILPREGTVRLNTDVVAYLRTDRLFVFVRSRYTQTDPGPLRHVVELPPGWEVRKVAADGLLSWDVTEDDDGRRLIVETAGRMPAGREITWSAERPFTELPETLTFRSPRAVFAGGGTRREETVHWLFASDDELRLAATTVERLEPVTLDAAPTWVRLPEASAYRFAYRSRYADARLVVRPTTGESRLGATAVSFARLGETHLHVNSRLLFRIRVAGRERFRIRLPRGAELVYADTRNQRSQVITGADGGTEVAIELLSAVRGEHAVDVVYRLPRQAEESTILSPLVILDGARRLTDVDQYVGVVQTERTFTLGTQAQGLAPVETESLPLLPSDISARSLRPTYRATSLDWSLSLNEEEIETVKRLDAIIELADISTRIGNDGTLRTQVVYTLVNDSLQFLTLELPPAADLWGVTVNGRSVAVGGGDDRNTGSRGGAILQVPVEQVGRSELPLEVVITYEEPPLGLPAIRTSARLSAPRIVEDQSVQIVQSLWSVQFPEGYHVSERGGRMRQAPPSLKHAEKLEGLLEQRQEVLETARHSDSKRARERANRQLARLEQALGDNLAGLEDTNRSAQEMKQQKLIGQEDLRRQWDQNDRLLDQARRAQSDIQRELEKQKEEDSPAFSRDEEAFNDRANFLKGRAWRGGRKARPLAPSPPSQTAEDSASLLLERYRFDGLNGISLDIVTPEADFATPAPVDSSQGLAPLPDPSRLATAPGLELHEAPAGFTTYTFRRSDGDAALTLRFTRESTWPRAAAWSALVLMLAGWLWRRRRATA